MAFEINSSSPPAGCAPGGRSGAIEWPTPSGMDGNGVPCGIVGKPRITLRFDNLSVTGWAWYVAYTGASAYVAITSLTVWNPHAAGGPAWTTFSSGIMHRPTYDTFEFGAYKGVKILFTELVEA